MELAPRGNSVQNGFFLDPGRFHNAIGDDFFSALRYYETGVQVVTPIVGTDKKKQEEVAKASKNFHRFILLTETVLFVLDVNKKEAHKDIWGGHGANPPIWLKSVLSIKPLAKRSEIFAEDEMNKVVRHFEITYQVKGKNNSLENKTIELASWENGSLLLDQIRAAWINVIIRLCLKIEISISLDADNSKSELHDLYQEIVRDITYTQCNQIQDVICSMSTLAESALQDRELKRLFFTLPALYQYLLAELRDNQLPSKTTRFKSRSEQLQYVYHMLLLFHCMVFNSQIIVERSNLLTPGSVTFVEMLEILTTQYDQKAVQRELHRLELGRKKHVTSTSSEEESDKSDGEDEFDYNDEIDEEDDAHAALELMEDQDESNGKDIHRSISEMQTAILMELDDFISLAVSQGRSRAIVSETLGHQLCKTSADFPRFVLPKYVKHLVSLISKWDVNRLKSMDLSTLAVRIYQHIKFIHGLIFGSYQMLEYVLDNNEEELRYYLFKEEFFGRLNDIPSGTKRFLQITILNRRTREMIVEIRQAIDDLQTRRDKESKATSIILM